MWFGCDVGKFFSREKGLLDVNLFSYEAALGVNFNFDKKSRLQYGESLMTHAMTFTGVDERNGKTTKYKVLNSWTDTVNKGYLSMSDEWFSQYVYQIVLGSSELPKEITQVLEQEPIPLPAWDPLGALAN